MINQLIKLLTEDFRFFLNLTIEHILISLLAISIASVLGIILGIIISEYRRFSGLILGTVNILYTIPSIALLGFLFLLATFIFHHINLEKKVNCPAFIFFPAENLFSFPFSPCSSSLF